MKTVGMVRVVGGYVDVDWVGDIMDCRSTSGFTFSVRSMTIAWSGKKQPTVVL